MTKNQAIESAHHWQQRAEAADKAQAEAQAKLDTAVTDLASTQITRGNDLAKYLAKLAEAAEDTALLRDRFDALTGTSPKVFGLPCICESPELHEDTCVRLRELVNAWAAIRAARGKKP